MIRVAIDITPLSTASKFRGVGMYTQKLVEALKAQKSIEVLTFTNGKIPDGTDLVHYPYFFPFMRSLPFFPTKKFVVTVHDLIPLVFPKAYPPGLKGKIVYELQKIILKKASMIITDSESSKKDIVRFLNYPQDKIKVVYLAPCGETKPITDKKVLKCLVDKFSLPQKFVLYVGDANYNKNLPGLVTACRIAHIPLVLVGRQIKQTDFDQSHIENQPLVELNKMINGRDNVIKLGFVEDGDLAGIFSLASVYCQPSFYEGFGLPVLEAMAYGCPVIASNVSSLPEIVGEAATLVDPDNAKEIANGIRKLITDQRYRQQIIDAGFVQVKKFSWNKVGIEVADVYKRILAEEQ